MMDSLHCTKLFVLSRYAQLFSHTPVHCALILDNTETLSVAVMLYRQIHLLVIDIAVVCQYMDFILASWLISLHFTYIRYLIKIYS